MPASLPIADFLTKARHLTVIDVRSPAEFAQGRIPGAVNIPLFSNEERAQIGTLYKQVSQEEAFLAGLDLVGPKMAQFVRQSKPLAQNQEILVHCWRGGMRSGSFGWLLETAGMKVSTLSGGYKAFRTQVLEGLTIPKKLVVLGGKTGSGKTEILHQLRAQGEQILDLEALAHHKGSSYGAIGQEPQPSTEQFENEVFAEWNVLDASRRIWIEDESRKVGRCLIPQSLWNQMQQAPVVMIQSDKQQRIERLVREYACYDKALLVEATRRIGKRLGGQHVKAALEALDQNDFATVADITLNYYDKAYLHGLEDRTLAGTLSPEHDDARLTAQQLCQWADHQDI
ncbi:tRNA 2-selenouridine(34) synthase MnmH [Arundinibacter roseus]|uniref:tRNA 2-selenouridine(34) synthase MnmH n=1 Tax=Arundinibacter roseus TaxID=2070510 RepID=A0A4R4KDP9_9BACT|nr:tRNA 2-selenouridine(34) synthase MnmH [Arundinibacter roseus]TDB66074.1 tRNA 2-selenouridine(34) synthase MnmH [Arundinibacter roseus]